MAINLTYDTANDPDAQALVSADEQESYEIGERLEQEQNELLAGKFRSAEELERAYAELERKLGSGERSEEQEEAEPDDDPVVGLMFQAGQEWEENGQFSPETRQQLEQMDSRALLDTYMKYISEAAQQQQEPTGVQLSDSQINSVYSQVGGESQYKQMIQWAGQNLSQEEISAFDQVMDSGNLPAINLAVRGLQSRYTDAYGYDGQMLQGKPARAMDVFRSQAELVRAMNDPRYDNDPAYRQDIFNKLDRSDLRF